MSKFPFKFLIALFVLGLNTSSYGEPANLALLKNEVKAYHDTGVYEKELAKVISEAQNFILHQAEMAASERKTEKLAVILDIDETSLSNYAMMVKRDFVADRATFHKEILAADATVIPPMLSLFNTLRQKGIEVFFVTGRSQNEMEATKTNLLNAGYKGWAGLYLKPDNYNQASIIPFKTQARKTIAEQGYTIIASIGDQYSDIEGGYFQKGFKLPNPYYYLP